MSRNKPISLCEKKFLLDNLNEYNRLDGRTFDEFRELKIQFGKDLGNCTVSLGKTQVIAQVSCEIQEPKSSRPSEGIMNVNIELNPIASLDFEPGRPSDQCVQLNRLLEKCLKDSKAVDLESLCIKTNEKVWALRVDVNVINHEGNILDCASVGALAALAHFRRPDVTCDGEDFTIHSYKERDPIPTVIHHYPVCITYGIFNRGQYVLADPDLLEEGVAEAQLTVNLNSYKELCGLHLGGQAELSSDIILQITNKAATRAVNIVHEIKDAIEADTKIREEKGPVGFHTNIQLTTRKSDSVDINTLLENQWAQKSRKHKKWKKSEQKVSDNNDDGREIVLLENNSAALVPKDDSENPWVVID